MAAKGVLGAYVGLLDHKDDRLKRLAAKNVIGFLVKQKETEDLDRRLTEVKSGWQRSVSATLRRLASSK